MNKFTCPKCSLSVEHVGVASAHYCPKAKDKLVLFNPVLSKDLEALLHKMDPVLNIVCTRPRRLE